MPKLSVAQIRARQDHALRNETVASGALSLDCRVSRLAISGTVNFTLANGTWDGQEKEIYTLSAASTPVATVTVASMLFSTNTISGFGTVSSTAHKSVVLKWNATAAAWLVKSSVGVTFSTV